MIAQSLLNRCPIVSKLRLFGHGRLPLVSHACLRHLSPVDVCKAANAPTNLALVCISAYRHRYCSPLVILDKCTEMGYDMDKMFCSDVYAVCDDALFSGTYLPCQPCENNQMAASEASCLANRVQSCSKREV